MAKQLGLATGNVYRFLEERDQNDAIGIIEPFFHEHDLSCLEITWGKEPVEINLSKETLSFLTSLEVSVHYPFTPEIKDNPETRKVMKKVSNLVKEVDASRVVIHPRKLSDIELISEFQEEHDINLVLELEDLKGIELSEFTQLLRTSNLDFVFDTGHAEFYELEKIKSLIKEFKHRICEIHVNKVKDGEAHHSFVQQGMSETFPLVKDLDVPFIIEEDFEKGNLEGLEQEIVYLKNYIFGEM